MDINVLFEEAQGSGKKSVRDFLKIVTGLFVLALAFNLTRQKGNINEITGGLFAGLLIFAIAAIFASTKMVTQIRNDGIYVRFPPFQPSFNKFSWDNIQDLYLRKYDALSEYSGWGIKIGPMGRGYIISGDTGIQIVLRDNTKILISTQRPDEIEDILNGLKKLN